MAKAQKIATVTTSTQRAALPWLAETKVDESLQLLTPIVHAIGATLGAHCEVVLHDLRVPERSIVAISNGQVTGRHVGGPVIGGPLKDVALGVLDSSVHESALLIGYETKTKDGRTLRSTSIIVRTPTGKPVLALCLNVDLTPLTLARRMLEEISKPGKAPAGGSTANAGRAEVADIVARIIRESLEEVGKLPQLMTRENRLQAVRLMHDRGLFLIRGGVERAAAAMGLSRFTLYSYLKEVRNGF
jgi:predicted transcriptional regulator YheO